MRHFELLNPTSLPGAAERLADDPEAKAIAGGTALLVLIKHGVYLPGTLVNLRAIPDVATIQYDPAAGLRVGALAPIGAVERDPAVRKAYPVLAEACHVVANVRIRNLATLGGNLAHADYQSDPPAVLLALGAAVELVDGAGATRSVPLADFLIAPYETDLRHGEVVAAITVPPPEPGWAGAYLKFTTRSSEDRPCAGATVLVCLADGALADARVVVGAVGPTPAALAEAGSLVAGRAPESALYAALGSAAAAQVAPIDDLRGSAAYKRRVAGVLVERAAAIAVERAKAVSSAGGRA